MKIKTSNGLSGSKSDQSNLLHQARVKIFEPIIKRVRLVQWVSNQFIYILNLNSTQLDLFDCLLARDFDRYTCLSV